MIVATEILDWLQQLLDERLGVALSLNFIEKSKIKMTIPGESGYVIFDRLESAFYSIEKVEFCEWWKVSTEGLKKIIDDNLPAPTNSKLRYPLLDVTDKEIRFHYDILGLIYWSLTRQEEIVESTLDSHNRFPATSSHAYQFNYLSRPIVDEWINILQPIVVKRWPLINVSKHEFSQKVSHDVDLPSAYVFKNKTSKLKNLAGDLFLRRDSKKFFDTMKVMASSNEQLHGLDPFNTFEWIMDVSEENELKSAFYFICGRTNERYDTDYDVNHPLIRDLMRKIHNRGHEIGLHPSYDTYHSAEKIKYEFDRLLKVCSEENITQPVWGGRMHYLRWQQPLTLNALSTSGLFYDASLGYADRSGFRCGTCIEYQAFDPLKVEKVNLRIRPLIIMEQTVLSESYMGLGVSESAKETILDLKDKCRAVNGTFTLLWHNSMLVNASLKKFYRDIVEG